MYQEWKGESMHVRFMHVFFIGLLCAFVSSCGEGGSQTPGGIPNPSGPSPTPPSFTIDKWQWRNPLPQGNTLYDITYANGTYIAVGEAGTILNFSDGIESSGTFLGLYSVTFGNGTFVAVGAGNTILTSETGTTWTSRTQFDPTKSGYNSVAFGNNTFVAVGFGNVYTSQDTGVTWNTQSLLDPSLNLFRRVQFANNLFVATTDTSTIFTSPDGVTWTAESLPTTDIGAIGYGQGKFVAISSGGVYTSVDAITWTLAGFIADAIDGLAYGNGTFVAVGNNSGLQGVIYSSSDAKTWTKNNDIFSVSLNQVAFFNGQFIAIGAIGLIATSLDGQTWTNNTSNMSNLPFVSIAYGNNLFIAAANDQYITGLHPMFSSPDGIVWMELPPLPNNEIAHRIKYMDNRFYAFCTDSIFASPDGINWTTIVSSMGAYFNDLIYANNLYIALGASQTKILTSPDGVTWTERWTGPSYYGFDGGTFVNNLFVIVGNFGKIVTSQDGMTWSDANIYADDDFTGVAFGNNQFVAVGYNGTVYSSPDGINWTNRVYGLNSSLAGVIFTPNGFVAVGTFNADYGLGPDYHGRIHTSLDGISWVDELLTEGDLYSVAYGQNSYIVSGSNGTILQSNTVTFYPAGTGPSPLPHG